jgi:hypothetical protein
LRGGLGRALLVRRGGLTRRGVVKPADWALVMKFSLSSGLVLGLRVHSDLWFCSDSFRGLVLAGMLDMRRGITGGCCVTDGCEVPLAKYVGK